MPSPEQMQKKSNGQKQPPVDQAENVRPGDVLGFTITRDCLDGTIDVLKKRPWKDVWKLMPQLINCKPIIQEKQKRK